METLHDLKYKVQEIMTEKDEEASAIDAYVEQLEDRISKFDVVISSLESNSTVSRQRGSESQAKRGSRTGGGISKKVRAGEVARRNENGDEKAI